jgi:pilus assembly protein CpaE
MSWSQPVILLIDPADGLIGELRRATEAEIHHVVDVQAAQRLLEDRDVEVLVLGATLAHDEALDTARKLHEQHPRLTIVLCALEPGPSLYREAMRAGVSDILPFEATTDEVRDVLERAGAESARLRAAEAEELRQQPGNVLATFSTKGGCGKSFLATNLAVMLAQRFPGEVVLVDLDLQAGDVAIMLQLMPEHGLREVAELGEELDDEALEGFLTPAGDLKVLAAPDHPVHAEEVTPQTVTRVLETLRTMYRWIIIDGPPSFTEHMLAAIEYIDTIVVVSSLDVPSIKNLRLSVDTLRELGLPRDRLKLVLNRADSKVGLTVREVEKSLGTRIDVAIPSSREVPYAVNQGVAIVTARPRTVVARALVGALDTITDGRSGTRSTVNGADTDGGDARRRRRRRRG